MRIAKDSTYESRDMLLERIRRQKQTIKELIAERDNLKSRLDAMSLYRTEAAMLREQLRNWRKSIADIIDIIRRFREAIRDERTGDFIGGANRRRILADVDDAAVIAISAIAGSGRDTEKEKQ